MGRGQQHHISCSSGKRRASSESPSTLSAGASFYSSPSYLIFRKERLAQYSAIAEQKDPEQNLNTGPQMWSLSCSPSPSCFQLNEQKSGLGAEFFLLSRSQSVDVLPFPQSLSPPLLPTNSTCFMPFGSPELHQSSRGFQQTPSYRCPKPRQGNSRQLCCGSRPAS